MNNNEATVLGALFGFVCVFLIIAIVIGVLYLLTLQKALNRCSRRNRTMEPAMVWLNLIPLFNLYWGFHTVINVAASLKNEFADRDMDDGGDYGKSIGIWAMALNIASGIVQNVAQAANSQAGLIIAGPIGLAALVLFIIYWVRIAGYSKQLGDDDLRDDRDDDDERDDDRGDSPRRREPRDAGSTDIRSKKKDDRYS